MPALRIQLLGPPAILAGERRLAHPSRKAMALAAYLAMRADEHVSRAHLAALLWGDSAEDQARTSLRQALSQLRRLFREAGHDPLLTPFDNVVLLSEGIEIDARALPGGGGEPPVDPCALAELPGFLEGFAVPAPEFEAWASAQRNGIRARLSAALQAAAAAAVGAGAQAQAARALSLALTLDPLQEAVHRALMAALAAQGRSDEALAQYARCRELLAAELQVEPDAETRALAARIRAQRLVPPAEPEAQFHRYPGAAPTLVVSGAPDRPSHRFDTARAALSAALELCRGAGPDAPALAVVSDTGAPDEDRAAAMLAQAGPGEIAVDPRVYDQFRHWSPFAFEPPAAAGGGWRLVSEMPRHRLQVMPANETPEAVPAAEFSVAVLPLIDRSPAAGDFALGDVLGEEITHRLSRFRSLTVVAPSAGQAFRARGFALDEARIRLGVNYLVDGSVFRAGERLRIGLSLSDLRSGALVFSDQFDGGFEALFSHQDALIDRIATAIFRKAERAEVRRAERAPTADMGAYEWFLRGLAAHRRAGISPDNARDAYGHFSRALEIDPGFARALAWRICAVSWFAPEKMFDPGVREIQFALSIDEEDAEVQRIAGALHLYRGEFEDGIRHIERAVELNPSDAYLLAASAVYWAYYGVPENGLRHIERAMMLDPFLPVWCVEDHGVVLYSMENYGAAIESLRRLAFPTPRALCYVAAAQVAGGDLAAAGASVARLRHVARDYSVDELMKTCYYRRREDKAALRARLNQAGLD